MAFDNHANFAYGQVLAAPVPPGAGTLITLAAGQGANFPAAPFNIVVWPASQLPLASNAEIMRVTAVAGDQLTVVRAQEGSMARTVLATDQVMAAITKKSLTDIETAVAPTISFSAAAGSVPGTAGVADGQLAVNKATAELLYWDATAVMWYFIIKR